MGMLFLNNIVQNNLQLANNIKCFPKYKAVCDILAVIRKCNLQTLLRKLPQHLTCFLSSCLPDYQPTHCCLFCETVQLISH